MKNCDEIRNQFLDQPVPAEVKEHVVACAECAREWQSFASTFALLDKWESPEPSRFFDTRLRARLNELKAQEAQPRAWMVWMRGPMWRPVMASALAVVMIAGGAVLYQSGKQDQSRVVQAPKKGTAVADLKSMDQNQDLLSSDLLDDLNNNPSDDDQDQL